MRFQEFVVYSLQFVACSL